MKIELDKFIITFLKTVNKIKQKKIDLNKLSFKESREKLKNYSGSLSNAVIEERRREL